MNVAVMKTKAEQGFTEQFDKAAGRLPGGKAVKAARADAIGKFSALGLPHRRIEEWKYTDLRSAIKEALPLAGDSGAGATAADVIVALGPLAHVDAHRVVFVNGAFRADLSDFADVESVDVTSLATALATSDKSAKALATPTGPAADATIALNTALMTDGAVLRVAKGAAVGKPLLIAYVRFAPTAELTAVRNVISIGDGANATIIEAHVSVPGSAAEAQINALTELTVGKSARVAHIKVTADAGKTAHIATWNVALQRDATYRGFQFTSGAGLTRNQINAIYDGEGGKLDLSGVFLARGSSHVDTTLVVDHAVPHCESRELFKCVLDDDGRGVFQGKIIVRPDAQKTDGKQMAQVLMLSPNAEFDSKPELEIYADDVVCGHGATSAQLDEDLLFYCKSRGIPDDEARVLLIESFVGEAIDKIEHEETREAVSLLALQWLGAKSR